MSLERLTPASLSQDQRVSPLGTSYSTFVNIIHSEFLSSTDQFVTEEIEELDRRGGKVNPI